MSKLSFLYLSRNQNRAGYTILDHLISSGLTPSAVLLPKPELKPETRSAVWLRKTAYKAQCLAENSKPLRFLESEYLLAKKASIPIIRASSLVSGSPELEEVMKLGPDLVFLGGGWPGRLPPEFIRVGRLGILNTHPSLLPDFRGTSITRWQILEGVKVSGVTIHSVNEEFDAGPIVAQATLMTLPNETPQELFHRLSLLGADLATRVLKNIESTGYVPILREDHGPGKYYSKWDWSKSDKADFSNSFLELHRFVLANTQESYRFSGPLIRLNKRDFFLRETELVSSKTLPKRDKASGALPELELTSQGFLIARKPGDEHALVIKKIQPRDGRFGLPRASRPGAFFSSREKVAIDG